MSTTAAPLWQPTDARIAAARLTDYRAWLARTRGDEYEDYDALWRWSTSDLAAFWRSIWDYFEVIGNGSVNPAFTDLRMPGTTWFPAVELNYVDQVFRHTTPTRPAIVAGNEDGCVVEIGWANLERKVAALADTLRSRGVQRGDRIAGFLPNTPETVVAFLATASLGAIWSLCSPDMGVASVVDRFKQIGPKVLIAADGYQYGGRMLDRRAVVSALIDALPTVQTHVRVPLESLPATSPGGLTVSIDWAEATAADKPLRAEKLPFDHPLWIVYSSGTTGLPKPIVHGHGGILLEHLKLTALHNDVGPMDRFHWYSSTGWIMWNCQVGGLLSGATICIYDGSPAWPDLRALWRFAGTAGATFFGSGAAFYVNCMKAGITPCTAGQLDTVKTIGSTGSPLPADTHAWLQRAFGADAWIAPISGGTDIASAFVGGNCTAPVYPGEMQCRCLGAKVEAWSDAGQSMVGQVGELVCTAPMPSMPLYFWNDPDGRRYIESYFDVFPGVWRHGDWIEITPRGSAIIYGRSDSTINRSGIRMGTSEFYSAVEALPEVADSLVVDLEYLGRPSYMPLFVVLAEGATLDEALKTRINAAIRDALTPKHVPNEIFAAPAVPRTLSGKKLEVPIKRLLLGEPIERNANRDALANPESLDWYLRLAAARGAQSPGLS